MLINECSYLLRADCTLIFMCREDFGAQSIYMSSLLSYSCSQDTLNLQPVSHDTVHHLSRIMGPLIGSLGSRFGPEVHRFAARNFFTKWQDLAFIKGLPLLVFPLSLQAPLSLTPEFLLCTDYVLCNCSNN